MCVNARVRARVRECMCAWVRRACMYACVSNVVLSVVRSVLLSYLTPSVRTRCVLFALASKLRTVCFLGTQRHTWNESVIENENNTVANI